MSFPNVSDIVATTIESRSKEIADNVTKNNALLARLQKKGKVKPFSGGSVIYQELSFAENGNFGWYSGYDLLPVGAQDVLSAAQFSIKQAAAAIPISGLEQLQNGGQEAQIDLLEGRIGVAEATIANNISSALYSDGTGSGGKQLTGLLAAVADTPTSGTYGSIDRLNWTFWRNQTSTNASCTSSTVQGDFNATFAKVVRGKDRADLVVCDNVVWGKFMASLQTLQRFVDVETADLGFPAVKYFGADVVLDGGVGGYCPTSRAYFLNTDYIFFRPHKDRNMVALTGGSRRAVNQDAEVTILAWAGNLTCSNAFLQAVFIGA